MAEYSANAVQTVNPGETVIFTEAPVPCNRGLVRWRQGSGNFLLRGWLPNRFRWRRCRCCCRRNAQDQSANYLVDFGANVAVHAGQAVEPITLAITIDGATIPASTMEVTPAAVEQFQNVSRAINAQIWKDCCETVSVRNTSDIPINVVNANIIISRPDLAVTR